MIIFNFVLLIIASFSASAQAEICDVGVDGCSWSCKQDPLPPGMVTCLAYPTLSESCEIGSTSSMCGTTCTCTKVQTCTVGENGCSWNCCRAPLKPGQATCLALPVTPETCVVGESVTTCGTTCTCSQAPTCKVGESGCTWTCNSIQLKPGQATCLAIPGTPENCVIGSSVSMCGTTCTCSQQEKCKVGLNCDWSCVSTPPTPGMVQCMAVPSTPSECYIGETVSLCGTTCSCTARTCNNNFNLIDYFVNLLRKLLTSLNKST